MDNSKLYLHLTKYFPAFGSYANQPNNFSATNVAYALYQYPSHVITFISCFPRPEYAIPAIKQLIAAFKADTVRNKQQPRTTKKRRAKPPGLDEDVVHFLTLLITTIQNTFMCDAGDISHRLLMVHHVGGDRSGLRCHYLLPFQHPRMYFINRTNKTYMTIRLNWALQSIPGYFSSVKSNKKELEDAYTRDVNNFVKQQQSNHVLYFCPCCGGLFARFIKYILGC